MKKRNLIIGVPKEVKPSEGRVGLTPGAVERIKKSGPGTKVMIQAGAGAISGFADKDYRAAGAVIAKDAKKIYGRADIVVKVKEIVPQEFSLLKPGQTVFTYLHPSANRKMVETFLGKKIFGVSYDTIQTDDGKLPVLKPMSEVAGMLAIDKGLELKPDAKNVTIVGAGIAGLAALNRARERGFGVRIFDVSDAKLQMIREKYPQVTAVKSTPMSIIKYLKDTDLLVGAVLVPGACAPKVIIREMLRLMRPGSVIVDISIDQGGCVETSHPTTHAEPVFTVEGIIHYCVANMPGCVPKISTPKLVEAHLPYLMEMLGKGLDPAGIMAWSGALKRGVVTRNGRLTNGQVAHDLGLEYAPLEEALK